MSPASPAGAFAGLEIRYVKTLPAANQKLDPNPIKPK
jgi:hypothetical protein